MDNKELLAGTTVYLPVHVKGALFEIGDGHAGQGNGEVDITALETSLTGTLQFIVRTDLKVRAGDRVLVEIEEGTPGLWTIRIRNRSTGETFSLTLPYASTYGSAEWVIETPVVISETTGAVTVGPMPDLSVVHFNHATANGKPAGFVPAERMELVDFDLTLIATPSLPDRQADGFNDCTYRVICPAPRRS